MSEVQQALPRDQLGKCDIKTNELVQLIKDLRDDLPIGSKYPVKLLAEVEKMYAMKKNLAVITERLTKLNMNKMYLTLRTLGTDNNPLL